MSDDHLTSESDCPDCSGFDRCDFHEGVRRGRQQIKDGDYTTLEEAEENCEKSGYHIEYTVWDGNRQFHHEGYFMAESRLEAINDLLYEYRHDDCEVTCIEHIEKQVEFTQKGGTE